MPLENSIETITEYLRAGRFPNESAISQAVVIRILSELGWDTYNTEHVWPEYSIAGRRVDFALCFPAKKPAIFIEVKQPGRAEGGDQQLFEYAYHEGVPMAILCDGKTWGFYLPAEQGSYDERRVYKLDLLERPSKEAADKLTHYLSFQRTISGAAIEDARRDFRNGNRRALARRTIQDAWTDLVDGEEPNLVNRLAIEVETKCGIKPENDDVVAFLKTLRAVPQIVIPTKPNPEPPVDPAISPENVGDFTKFIITLGGNVTPPLNKRESILEVVRYLGQTGVAPEEMQAIFTGVDGKSRFLSANGLCKANDAVKQISESSGRPESAIRLRNFNKDNEILHHHDQTYLVSNQWGMETHEVLKALANAFPKHNIRISGV